MSQQRLIFTLLTVLFSSALGLPDPQSSATAAELTRAEQKQWDQVNQGVRAAGKHYAAGRYEEAGTQIKNAWDAIKDAHEKASPELQKSLIPLIKRIRKAHTLLSLEGVSLPPITLPPGFGTAKQPQATIPQPISPPVAMQGNDVSFTKTISPILVNRCGKCHVAGSKGGFQMSSYAGLMKGAKEGVVIFPGDAIGSRLIETIETGDMPRGNGNVTPEELVLIRNWVKAGAKFDGDDPTSSLSGDVAMPMATNIAPTMQTAKRGVGTVSFAKDIAGLLSKNCNGCHVNARQVRGRLRMDNFSQILRGGDSGAILEAGNGANSLLVKRLRGMGGDRMPGGGRPALSEAEIQRIIKWIDEGAMLDGKSDKQPLETMHKIAIAGSSTPEEMTAKRLELAKQAMNLSNGSGQPIESKETEHFQVTGAASKATIELVARLAEEQIKTAAALVSAEVGQDLFAGKATVFVFTKRYDYSEFAKMTEGRNLPNGWTSHWSFDGIHAYIAVVASERDDEEEVQNRLVSPIYSVAVATRGGDLPRWFAEGVGVAAANNRQKLTRSERNERTAGLLSAVGQTNDAKQFLEGKLPPEVSDQVGTAIASSLIAKKQRKRFSSMMRRLKDGESFEQAFANQFGKPPALYIQQWLAYVKQ